MNKPFRLIAAFAATPLGSTAVVDDIAAFECDMPVSVMFRACSLAVLLVTSSALAQEAADAPAPEPAVTMKGPRVVPADVNWDAVRAALGGIDLHSAHDAPADAPQADALTRLNVAAEKIFPKIAASAVPVLLPFDTGGFLRDAADGTTGDSAKYLAAFSTEFFFPGPSGYDAAFSLQAEAAGLNITFAKPVHVQITGSTLTYELDGPAVSQGAAVPELQRKFPGIRRLLLENRVRYTFVRFGVPYFVSIQCFDGGKRKRRLACREADQIAVRFLNALDIAGGAPSPAVPSSQADGNETGSAGQTIRQPEEMSPDFTYYAPGDILPGTGMRGQGGHADATVYANIRFPMAQAPAYTNSQSFMNWGNCDFTGRVALGGHGKNAAYRCRVNGIPLIHDESKNYAYPWRDNFCEHRHYTVSQCPAGLGHQGEDIRPGSCKLRNDGADRCEPYQHDVVAASSGVAWRTPGDEALYLIVNAPGEHVRLRYLHMNPHMLDAAGIVSGRSLGEGEVIGLADDYGERQGGTTYHLHLDLQVLTRRGWVYVNPYMTLVAAYERLIGGRGRLVTDARLAAAADGTGASSAEGRWGQSGESGTDSAALSSPLPPATSNMRTSDASVHGVARIDPKADAEAEPKREAAGEGKHTERKTVDAGHCQTRFFRGHRRRVCGTAVAESHERGGHAHVVGAVDHHVSLKGDRAGRRAGDLRARHEHVKARHRRA